MQGLYQLDVQRAEPTAVTPELIDLLLQESELTGEPAQYGRELLAGTWKAHERYDQMIATSSSHWELSRMAVVDRNILRLALHELVERLDVPTRVVIDEAIELGREFGAAETPQFVNGVLDALLKQHPTCRIARAVDDPGRYQA